MTGDESWHSSANAILVAAVILALLVVVMVLDRAPSPPVETQYLHQHSGRTDGYLGPADAAMQAKGIAAIRHRPPGDIRQLMADCTEGRGVEPLGHQRISVEYFNRMLDERWPIK